jgi:ornithine cyclodeaminase/alanine dehydrogenase
VSNAPRFLAAADIKALLPTPEETTAWIEEALRVLGGSASSGAGSAGGAGAGSAAGTATGASGGPVGSFLDRAAADASLWVADHVPGAGVGVGAGAGAGSGAGPLVGRRGLAALLAAPGGAPVLVLERAPLIVARHAACTAVAARHLADPNSEVISIIGCNDTGRAVMAALLSAFPDTERMLCYDPDVAAQNAFADEIMTTYELASIIPPEPRECTEGAHILVSCLPVKQPPAPVVEPGWLQTGTLCVALDLDATLTPATFAHADRRLTDHLPGFRDCVASGHLAGVTEPGEELAAVVAGRAPGRGEGVPIIASIHVGHPALDALLAAELLRRAEAAGKGTLLSA